MTGPVLPGHADPVLAAEEAVLTSRGSLPDAADPAPRWVSWITGRGNYGRTHLVAQSGGGRPLTTACGRDVGFRWRLSTRGLRCWTCDRIAKAGGK